MERTVHGDHCLAPGQCIHPCAGRHHALHAQLHLGIALGVAALAVVVAQFQWGCASDPRQVEHQIVVETGIVCVQHVIAGHVVVLRQRREFLQRIDEHSGAIAFVQRGLVVRARRLQAAWRCDGCCCRRCRCR